MTTQNNTDPIIVIVATSLSRTNFLLEKSLESVYQQKNINPHQIYIVDDNPISKGKQHSEEYPKINKVIKKLRKEILKPKFQEFKDQVKINNLKFDNYFHTNCIQNTRTKGFSGTGAWNSGAFKSLRYSGRNYFLAFLDDDDEWKPNYLETLYQATLKSDKKSINGRLKNIKIIASVSGFLRIEKDKKIEIQATQENFNKESFFIGNPGLQGSNLFIDLKTFWTIGGFDESLRSATDRDLAIRLMEYLKITPSKKITFVDKILVNHYAISENRVTANLNHKKEGLDLFYRKYYHQFSEDLQSKSLQRAKELFNYHFPRTKKNNPSNASSQIGKSNNDIKPFNLVVGTISDSGNNLTELFKSFSELLEKYPNWLNDYIFIVLENTENEYEIRPVIEYFIAKKGLHIEIIKNPSNNRSIAENRTWLQKVIYNKGDCKFDKDYISWIIDDDHLFKFDTKSGIEVPNYFKIISNTKEYQVDAVFGKISDAPPLPFLNTLRTQLIDFYYNLTYFVNCDPEGKFQLNHLQTVNEEREEHYYDLSSKNYQHLEYPYYQNFHQSPKQITNKKAFSNFLEHTSSLSKGVNVFRKITFEEKSFGEIIDESIHRGGNTVIYNSKLLLTPNYTPEPEKKYNRRSDFNWAIINKDVFDNSLYEIVMPLKHDRKLQNTSLTINKEKLEADIKGLIFYRLLQNIIENHGDRCRHKSELRYYKRIKDQTFRKIKISNYRTLNLIHLILAILKNVKLWFFKNEYRPEINYSVQQNIFLLEVLRFELGKRKSQTFNQELEENMRIDNDFIFISEVIKDIKCIKSKSW